MARRTATTANAILGLLAIRKEWSTWELTTHLRRNMRFFWPRAESQIYAEVKTLVGRGWARDRQTFVGRRVRTSYRITAAGKRAGELWGVERFLLIGDQRQRLYRRIAEPVARGGRGSRNLLDRGI